MPIELRLWWSWLIAIAVFNMVAWCCIAKAQQRQCATMSTAEWRARQLMLLLSAGYVAGCAYRSFFPVFDIPRLTLADSVFASAFVGRTVATCAELCFAAQWALLLRSLTGVGGGRSAALGATLVFPLIGLAECASWHAVLTRINLGHVVEETLWGICALIVLLAVLRSPANLWPDRRTKAALSLLVFGYALYMFFVDVPLYFFRWMEDIRAERESIGTVAGVIDAAFTRSISHDWSVWRGEAIWMGAYFSLGVWTSLALAVLPIFRFQREHSSVNYSAFLDSFIATPSPRRMSAT
jgi:hypothetical protein